MGDPLSGNRRADGAWFVYARMPGRITGYPANWKGLAFLIGSILGVTALGLLSAHLWNTTGQIAWFIGFFVVVFPSFFVLLFALMRAKGRRVDVKPGDLPVNRAMNEALVREAARDREARDR